MAERLKDGSNVERNVLRVFILRLSWRGCSDRETNSRTVSLSRQGKQQIRSYTYTYTVSAGMIKRVRKSAE